MGDDVSPFSSPRAEEPVDGGRTPSRVLEVALLLAVYFLERAAHAYTRTHLTLGREHFGLESLEKLLVGQALAPSLGAVLVVLIGARRSLVGAVALSVAAYALLVVVGDTLPDLAVGCLVLARGLFTVSVFVRLARAFEHEDRHRRHAAFLSLFCLAEVAGLVASWLAVAADNLARHDLAAGVPASWMIPAVLMAYLAVREERVDPTEAGPTRPPPEMSGVALAGTLVLIVGQALIIQGLVAFSGGPAALAQYAYVPLALVLVLWWPSGGGGGRLEAHRKVPIGGVVLSLATGLAYLGGALNEGVIVTLGIVAAGLSYAWLTPIALSTVASWGSVRWAPLRVGAWLLALRIAHGLAQRAVWGGDTSEASTPAVAVVLPAVAVATIVVWGAGTTRWGRTKPDQRRPSAVP